jgi:hypothetical protein
LKEFILFELQALLKSIILLRQVSNPRAPRAAPPSPHPALVLQNEAPAAILPIRY